MKTKLKALIPWIVALCLALGTLGVTSPADATPTSAKSHHATSKADKDKFHSASTTHDRRVSSIVDFLGKKKSARANRDGQSSDNCVDRIQNNDTSLTITACDYSEDSWSVDQVLADRDDGTGRTQLSYMHQGVEPWNLKLALQCKAIYVNIDWTRAHILKVVNAAKKKVNGHWCVRLKHGSTWSNHGKEGKIKKGFKATVHGKFALMVLNNKTGVWEHFGMLTFSGGFVQVCRNDWGIGEHPTLDESDVVMVESEAQVYYKTSWTIASNGHVAINGTKRCPDGTVVNFDLSASSSGTGTGFLFVQAASQAKAIVKGQAAAQADTEAHANAVIDGENKTVSKAMLSLKIDCGSSQPPNQQPPLVSITQINDVDAGKTSPNTCAPYTTPHSGVLSFSTRYGKVDPFQASTYTVNGSGKICVTYVAPTEQPPGDHKDTMSVKLVDNTTGLYATDSTTFLVNPPTTHPRPAA
jgi:hypothetical protein